MTDIIVTTPKSQMKTAADEARQANGQGFYFRVLSSVPKDLKDGDRIWYVEDGFIRGFGIISSISVPLFGRKAMVRCETTGTIYQGNCVVRFPVNSWHWTKPVPMKGFQGWRYFRREIPSILGCWDAPKPEVK